MKRQKIGKRHISVYNHWETSFCGARCNGYTIYIMPDAKPEGILDKVERHAFNYPERQLCKRCHKILAAGVNKQI